MSARIVKASVINDTSRKLRKTPNWKKENDPSGGKSILKASFNQCDVNRAENVEQKHFP